MSYKRCFSSRLSIYLMRDVSLRATNTDHSNVSRIIRFSIHSASRALHISASSWPCRSTQGLNERHQTGINAVACRRRSRRFGAHQNTPGHHHQRSVSTVVMRKCRLIPMRRTITHYFLELHHLPFAPSKAQRRSFEGAFRPLWSFLLLREIRSCWSWLLFLSPSPFSSEASG